MNKDDYAHKKARETEQYECFWLDCLRPSVKGREFFADIWNTYTTYCQAVSQTPELSKRAFALQLNKMFHEYLNQGRRTYGCTIRENLFVRED